MEETRNAAHSRLLHGRPDLTNSSWLSPKYVSNDFTVLHPWYKEFEVLGNVDRSILAPDCLHYGI